MATADTRYALFGRVSQPHRGTGIQRQGKSSSVRGVRSYPSHNAGAKDLCRRPRWRFIGAVAAVVAAVGMWVLVQGHAVVRSDAHVSHPAHALASSPGGKSTINSDHAHLGRPSSGGHHEAFAVAVLPNSPAPLVAAAAVAVAALAGGGVFWQPARLSGRSPPRGLAAVLTGQDLLTRLCFSRR